MPALLSDTGLVFGRYFRQFLRSKTGVLFGLLQPLLFLALFGPLLRDMPLGGEGDSWQILVPGLLVQLGLFSAAFAGFGILLEKQSGVIERMRVTPVSPLALLLGRVLTDAVRLLAQSVLVVLAGWAFGLRAPVVGVLIAFFLVGLLGISLASLSYALALRVSGPQEFAPLVNSVNLPAMLLSGILLPMTLAPGWLDGLSQVMPFRYLVDAGRAAFVGVYGDGQVLLGTTVGVAMTVAALIVGSRVFQKDGS